MKDGSLLLADNIDKKSVIEIVGKITMNFNPSWIINAEFIADEIWKVDDLYVGDAKGVI